MATPELTLDATVEPGYPSWFHFTIAGAPGSAALDFGDDQVLTVAGDGTYDHVYAAPGDYTAVVTADSTTASVLVTAAGADAIVTPDELEALLGLSEEDAKQAAALVQLAVSAYLWPYPIPEPVPPPMHAIGLALAARFAGAELTKAGSIVSETVGSYSYRTATPLTFDDVVIDELLNRLAPWAPPWRQTSYTLDTSGAFGDPWPVDYWQRDLDRLGAR